MKLKHKVGDKVVINHKVAPTPTMGHGMCLNKEHTIGKEYEIKDTKYNPYMKQPQYALYAPDYGYWWYHEDCLDKEDYVNDLPLFKELVNG